MSDSLDDHADYSADDFTDFTGSARSNLVHTGRTGEDKKPDPAPRRDLTGVWDTQEGIQATGAKNEPSDGKHILPYTPLGKSSFKANKPGWGVTGVAVAQVNDPVDICDPQGFPRVWLHNLRTTEIVQTPTHVLILYEFYKVWRSIWTDGRELPKDAADDPRWYGYSVGKWVSDDTFVAQTVGLDERTWLDNTGRPHSKDLRVEERFHRVDHDTLELTVTIDDPQMYTNLHGPRQARIALAAGRFRHYGEHVLTVRNGGVQ